MPTDLEIAHSVKLRDIRSVAAEIGLTLDEIELYGNYKAKLTRAAVDQIIAKGPHARGKLILVTAITPTPAGEGKTTVAIGIAQALVKIGTTAIAAIREPSMGPVFGMKGGATGGGLSQVLPMEDINLHFTGDMHAITSANNLLAALVDNHIYRGNTLQIDSRSISHQRCIDTNDRALRQTVVGLGGKPNGFPRQTGFAITVASEVMAILCLSESLGELKQRLGAIVIGQNVAGDPVTAADLGAHGAMTALLRDALKPNLVQTIEGGPAIVHGGPFGNIAHGCSSVLGTKTALNLAQYVVTEAGFGSDLGFEKFCDIVAAPRQPHLNPDLVVLIATVRALKMHGGIKKSNLAVENVDAVRRGLPNLIRHAANVAQIDVPFIVAINKFTTDTEAEVQTIVGFCVQQGWKFSVCNVWGEGGAGAVDLAQKLVGTVRESDANFKPIISDTGTVMDKLQTLARNVYGADEIVLGPEAAQQLEWINHNGFGTLPVCVAKTQYSFTDDPTQRGAPSGFTLRVRSMTVSAGAGFIVALIGDIMTMPGLPAHPAALDIDINSQGNITGLF